MRFKIVSFIAGLALVGCGTATVDMPLDVDGDGELSVSHGGTDCDDFSATTNSQAEEIWGNTADENCDGYQADADGDGFGSLERC